MSAPSSATTAAAYNGRRSSKNFRGARPRPRHHRLPERGRNLQEWFDAVLHYDLPWNPNRLEQREGRVDRYGQAKKTIRTGLLYGTNNQVDLVVLRVLIEKARTIRQRLGISVPVPVESEQVVQAVIDRVLLHDRADSQQLRLALEHPGVNELHEQMDQSAERERRHRGHYAQAQIDPDAVRREVDAVRRAIGTPDDVRRFVADAIQRFNGQLSLISRWERPWLHISPRTSTAG